MSLIPMFSMSDVTRHINEFKDKRIRMMVEKLSYVGENFVNNARERGDYENITSNLRSSIGYAVILEGENMKGGFPGEKAEGKRKAKELLEELIAKFPDNLVLVGFAGMEYAYHVEQNGKDVITSNIPDALELLNELRVA